MSVPAEQMVPYSPVAALQRTSQAMYPDLQEFGVRAPAANAPTAEATPASAGGPSFSQTLEMATKAKGRKLDREEIEAIRSQYVDDHVTPGLWSQKGMNKGKFDALKEVFDNKSERTIQAYLAQMAEAAGPAAANTRSTGRGLLEGARDTVASTLTSGIGGVVGGALHLADYGARYGNAAIDKLRGVDSSDSLATPTVLGELGLSVDRGTAAVDKALVSDATLAARQKLYDLIDQDASADEIAKHIVENSSSLTGILGNTIGMLTPAFATKIPKVAKALDIVRNTGRAGKAIAGAAPVLATGLPAVGSAGGQHESIIMNAPIADLLTSPEAKELYELTKELGLPEKVFRQRMAASGLWKTLAASAIANLALPGANPLNVERQIAGQVARVGGRTGRALRTAGAEAVEESIASGTEQVGQNLAQQDAGMDTATGRGVGTQAALGGALGALVGGGVAAIQGTPPAAAAPTNVPPTNTPPTAGPTVAPTAAPVAPVAQPVTAPPGPGIAPEEADIALATAQRDIKAATAGRGNIAKAFAAASTPEEAMQMAEAWASQRPAWEQMDAVQRQGMLEAIATVVARKAGQDVKPILQQAREALTPATAPPVVVQTPTPPGLLETPPAPAPEATAPVQAPPVAPVPEAAAPIQEPVVQPVVQPGTTEGLAPLPQGLQGAKPRYAYGARGFELDFESDAEKALYIVAGSKPSKADAEYMKWIRENLGLTPEDARLEGQAVREQIKALAKEAPKGVTRLTIPFGGTNTPPAAAPKVVPTAPQKRGKNLKAPATETPPVVETKAESKPLKKVPKPPKQVAPAQEVAGAQEQTTSAAPPTNVSPSAAKRETGVEAVARILGDSIDEADAKELAAAVELARMGETGPLEQGFKDLSGISQEDKKALREAGRSLKPSERGETEDTTKELPYPDPSEGTVSQAQRVKDAIKDLNAEQTLEWVANNGPSEDYRFIARRVLKRVRELQKLGVIFDQKLARPGTQELGARESASAWPMMWTRFNEGGPGLKVRIRLGNDVNQHTPGTGFIPILHEYVHAVTSVFQQIAEHPRVNFLTVGTRPHEIATELAELHKLVVKHVKAKPVSELSPFEQRALRKTNNALENAQELVAWGLTDRDFQRLLETIPVGPKKTAWGTFVDIVSKVLGITSRSQQTALQKVLELSEQLIDADLDGWLARVAGPDGFTGSENVTFPNTVTDSPFQPNAVRAEQHPLRVSTWQRLGEAWTNSTYGLERAEQEARIAGNTVDKDISPYIAGRLHTGHVADIISVDNDEVVNPVADYIAANWRNFSDTLPEFRKNLDLFLQSYHQLHERIPAMWLEQVPLGAGQNVTRAQLIDDANSGKITPQDFYAQLNRLVNRYATSSLAEWSKQASNAKDIDKLRVTLAQLKTKGFDEKKLADLNALLQKVRDRQQEHMIASGRISPTDPWVKARGWEWYVPLKGDPKASEDAADMDYGSFSGVAKEFRSRRMELMQGRTSDVESVVEQLVADMNQEGIKHAEREFKSALFGFVQANKPQMGATKITPVNGTLKSGFYRDVIKKDKKTGKRRIVQEPVSADKVYTEPKYGFVFHDGDTHYIVELDPKNEIAGNLDRGVKGFRNVQSPQGVLKALGMATNFMARSYTTWSLEWQAMVGFLRDTNFIPAMVAMDIFDNPLKAGKFLRGYTKRLLGNTIDLRNIKAEISGRKDILRARGKADPNSFAGQLFAYHEAGGSTEFAQSFNNEVAGNALFGKAESKSLGGKGLAAYNKLNEWTSNWAQLLENKGRVAAFTTLVKDLGMEPHEAAATVKGVMDFGQSGEYGRMVNAYLAFFRVGATSVDAMRRVFTTDKGKPNWPKLRNWSMFFSGLAAAGLGLMGMALGDDDEGKPRIRKFDVNTLTQKLIVPTGDGDVAAYPIGLGLPQLLMAPGTIGYMWSQGHITAKEAALAMHEVVTRNLPFQPAGWANDSGVSGYINSWAQGTLIPTPLRPVTETVANINAWDTSIHTPFKNDTKARSEQGLQATPQEWKDMAKELAKWGIDMYPEDIRHFTKGYGGQNASTIMRYAADNEAAEDIGIDTKAVRTALRLAVKDEDFYYTRELKRAERVLLNTQKRYKAADTPEEVAAFKSDPANKRRLDALKALESAKKAYYDNLTKIREANISVQGKRDRKKLADSALRRAVESAQGVIEATE